MADRRRVWRGVDQDLFRFTTTDLRDLHVALIAAFEDAAVLAPALNLEQVWAALVASDPELVPAMEAHGVAVHEDEVRAELLADMVG
jgi:hypothetical protein